MAAASSAADEAEAERKPLLGSSETPGIRLNSSKKDIEDNSSDDDEEKAKPSEGISARGRALAAGAARNLVCRGTVQDAMTYHMNDLCNWSSLTMITFTVFNRRTLWMTALKLFGLSMLIAFILVMVLTHPGQVQCDKFTEISSFLRVFVGLLLGFFMSASVGRWWSCAQGFLDLFTSIRILEHDLTSIGVPEDKIVQVLRFGYTSAWILSKQLYVEALPTDKQTAAKEQIWIDLREGTEIDSQFGKVTPEEFDALQMVGDPAGAMWMWIGSFLGHLSEEGYIPPMASPTYGRFLGLSQKGFDAIRITRSSIALQAPFIYVQMLSSLVHINNIVNAISFGITTGATVATFLVHIRVKLFGMDRGQATETQVSTDVQDLLVSFIFSCFGPFVYQALLECSIAIAQPFSNADAVVPTKRLLEILAQDLKDGLKVSALVPWKKPCFKK